MDITALKEGIAKEIEERSEEEVTHFEKKAVAPSGVKARNPAFDMTPNTYITAIITERGIVRPPYEESLRSLVRGDGKSS